MWPSVVSGAVNEFSNFFDTTILVLDSGEKYFRDNSRRSNPGISGTLKLKVETSILNFNATSREFLELPYIYVEKV